jgi:hypothetical protein
VGRGCRLPCRWTGSEYGLRNRHPNCRPPDGRPLRSPQGRGSDDAAVRTVADTDRARQRDGHIGIALNQHHVGGRRADHGPKQAPGEISDEGTPAEGSKETVSSTHPLDSGRINVPKRA